jgi:hypothetical protein
MAFEKVSGNIDRRTAMRNNAILDMGRVVDLRIASGIGRAGAVARMEGIPSRSVATARKIIALLIVLGGCCEFYIKYIEN